MNSNSDTPRISATSSCSAAKGEVRWSPVKSAWFLFHFTIAVLGGFQFFTLSGFLLFLIFTSITLCLGHSLGMHRRLIHNSYDCPIWLEYLFVHFGVLVGMAGPFGMIWQHDLRDWAQRQSRCHPYLRHGSGMLKDCWWQLHCDLKLHNPPRFKLEQRLQSNPVYRFMERTWMLQQLPWAMLFYYFGGVSWVVFGISARIAVSVFGHWLIGYYAHNYGDRDWHVEGAAVQGHNVRFAGLLTMGESWHNNHHAFPGSALLGIYENQPDPGWWVLNALHNLGLVWNIKLPGDLPARQELLLIERSGDVLTRKGLKPCKIVGLLS